MMVKTEVKNIKKRGKYMNTNLKEKIYFKYKEAVKLENTQKKDKQLVKQLYSDSKNMFDSYNVKFNKLLKEKETEIENLQNELLRLQEESKYKKQYMSLPRWIKKIYRI